MTVTRADNVPVNGLHAVDLLEAHHRRYGDYERLVFGDTRLSSLALRESARRLAAGLAAHGVGRGDRVMVMLPNCPDVFVVYEAIWRVGAAITPVLTALTESELTHVVKQARPRVLITDGERLELARRARAEAGVAELILVGAATDAADLALEALIDDFDEHPVEAGDPGDLATVLFTGGTTGLSKGVMLTHAALTTMTGAAQLPLEPSPDDVYLMALPLSHGAGLYDLLASYFERTRLVMLPRFTPERWARAVSTEGVTITAGVPSMLRYLLDHGVDRDTTRTLRWIMVGAAPVPEELVAEFTEATGTTVYHGYGLTEAGLAVAQSGPQTPSMSGQDMTPLDGVEVRVCAANGSQAPTGQPGELLVRSPGVMLGYWEDPATTTEALKDGWLHTGDVAILSEHGQLRIVGRTKDLIIRNGFNIYPLDVERLVRECADVDDVLAVGIPDRLVGERLAVAYVGTPSAESIEEHLRRKLAANKCPDAVLSVPQLPLTRVGKPDRKALAAQLADAVSRAVSARLMQAGATKSNK